MYLSLCPLLMPARKYATFILWPQPVQAYVCVRVKSVSTATPTGSMQHLFTLLPPPSPLSTYLPVACYVAVPVVACCMRWHFCHADILHFTAISQLPPHSPIPVLAETVPWFNFTQFVGAMLCTPPAPPPNCIFSNAIGYLEYLNAVISCRKLRLDLCACTPYGAPLRGAQVAGAAVQGVAIICCLLLCAA